MHFRYRSDFGTLAMLNVSEFGSHEHWIVSLCHQFLDYKDKFPMVPILNKVWDNCQYVLARLLNWADTVSINSETNAANKLLVNEAFLDVTVTDQNQQWYTLILGAWGTINMHQNNTQYIYMRAKRFDIFRKIGHSEPTNTVDYVCGSYMF
jgi:hypothetical protein